MCKMFVFRFQILLTTKYAWLWSQSKWTQREPKRTEKIIRLLISISFYTRQRICYSTYMLSPVRPSVCPSVTRVDQSKPVVARITKCSPHSSSIPLVFREQVSSRNSECSPRAGAFSERVVGKIGDFRPLSCHISETVQDMTKVVIDH